MNITPATPKVAALDYTRDLSTARQALLSKFPIVVLSMLQAQVNTAALPATLSFMTALRDAGARLAQYVVLNEWHDPQTSSSEQYGWWQQLNAKNWWALSQPGATKTQWTSAYGNSEVNPTRETPPDANGWHAPRAKAQWDWDNYLQPLATCLDAVFVDNVMFQPRVTADYNCDGVNETPAQSAPAFRTGFADYFNCLQAHLQVGIIGNSDCDTSSAGGYGCSLSKPELANMANGAFLEAIVGRNTSLETYAGVGAVLKWIRSAINSTQAPHWVIPGAYADLTSAAGIQTARYGLCISLLEDGFFCLNAATSGAPEWLDEFDQHIGQAVDGPQSAPAAGFNGLFARHYNYGLALVNPTTSAISVDLTGQGYRRFSGVQAPTVNNGQRVSVVTLAAKDGLLLVK